MSFEVSQSGYPQPPGLVIGGIDSRTLGIGTNHAWIDNLALTDPAFTALNLGIAGSMAHRDEQFHYELLGSTASNPHSTGTSTQIITLPSCIGYSLQRQIANLGSAAATIAPANGEAINGNAAVSPGSTGVFSPTPGPLNTGGCSWTRLP
ncbi:hypothetical protein [Edaphobacter bradus]|uniref:hypothetical protein n=1 Tax=Edaphobacter bradus TaxID=2259016 RepID=UPI0021DF756D|nr:hypothetical protein [Edaphobacter bradus]